MEDRRSCCKGGHDETLLRSEDVTATTESAGRPTSTVAVRAKNLSKVYGTGDTKVVALDDVSVAFPAAHFTAVMGPSGSGKSTLMHCLAGLDSATSGEVWVGETALTGLNDKALTQLRRDEIGFIFQAYNLVPTLSAIENITLPMDLAGTTPDREWLDKIIETVSLGDRLSHRPSELSGGQQQRVACARALASRPTVIFADEPTGNLDSRSSGEILSFLRDCVRTMGQTIVMVTHDPASASFANRAVFLADGRIVDEMADPTAESVLDRMKSLDTPAQRGN
jgi:putative ABC transport system ATP-binding protein